MAYSVTELAWSLLLFSDAYRNAGQLDIMYDSIRWPLDYLLRCHAAPNVLYGQVRNPTDVPRHIDALEAILYPFIIYVISELS